MRLFILSYCIAFIALAFLGRALRVYRKTGSNPIILNPTRNDLKALMSRLFLSEALLLATSTGAFVVGPRAFAWLSPIPWLASPVVGVSLLLASLTLILTAQAQMGLSWRVGIDESPTSLVQSGLFRRGRNPIYFGLHLSLWGLFLTIPSAVMLLTAGLGSALINIQVRLEEQHLLKLHGPIYEDFQRQVPRWF